MRASDATGTADRRGEDLASERAAVVQVPCAAASEAMKMVSGLELQTIGLILMIVGGLGLVLTLLFWSDFSPYRRRDRVADRDVVYEERCEVLR